MNSQNKQEKEDREAKSEEKSQKEPCCCPEGMSEMMAKCCEGMGADGHENMAAMMAKCCEQMKIEKNRQE